MRLSLTVNDVLSTCLLTYSSGVVVVTYSDSLLPTSLLYDLLTYFTYGGGVIVGVVNRGRLRRGGGGVVGMDLRHRQPRCRMRGVVMPG